MKRARAAARYPIVFAAAGALVGGAACASLSGLDGYDLAPCPASAPCDAADATAGADADATADASSDAATRDGDAASHSAEALDCDNDICRSDQLCCFRVSGIECSEDCVSGDDDPGPIDVHCKSDDNCATGDVCCAIDEGRDGAGPLKRIACTGRALCAHRACGTSASGTLGTQGGTCGDTQTCTPFVDHVKLARCL